MTGVAAVNWLDGAACASVGMDSEPAATTVAMATPTITFLTLSNFVIADESVFLTLGNMATSYVVGLLTTT
jgi:hypothetical protein